MSKIVGVVLGLCLVLLFWPRYNLYEKDGWNERYLLRQKGFWSEGACRAAGEGLDDPALCRKTSTWQGFWSNQEAHEEPIP